MDLILVPPLSPFNYVEWKLKMVAYLKRHEVFDVSIGVVEIPKYDVEKSIWFNDCDRSFGAMCLSIPPRMSYLIDIVEFPSEIWSILDRAFGQHIEEISTNNWESTYEIYLQTP